MSIYLEVTNGKYAASTVSLEDGDIARIGRGAKAEVFLPDDLMLAEKHFTLAFDGFSGRLFDSGSAGGTFLNSERILAAEIAENCRIAAGATEFAVLFENDFARSEIDTPIKRLVGFLRETEGDLFCLIDAARDEKILSLLRESNAKYMSLYQGESQKQLAHVAPYLIEFRKDDAVSRKAFEKRLGQAVVFFFCEPRRFRASSQTFS